MITVNNLHAELTKLINDGHGELICFYSSDDEGNSYKKIHNEPTLAQVENLEEWELELVGFYDEDDFSEEIDKEDVNAVCIN
jgi:hypothetical protein